MVAFVCVMTFCKIGLLLAFRFKFETIEEKELERSEKFRILLKKQRARATLPSC